MVNNRLRVLIFVLRNDVIDPRWHKQSNYVTKKSSQHPTRDHVHWPNNTLPVIMCTGPTTPYQGSCALAQQHPTSDHVHWPNKMLLVQPVAKQRKTPIHTSWIHSLRIFREFCRHQVKRDLVAVSHGFALHKGDFRDAVLAGNLLLHLQFASVANTVEHALSCSCRSPLTQYMP